MNAVPVVQSAVTVVEHGVNETVPFASMLNEPTSTITIATPTPTVQVFGVCGGFVRGSHKRTEELSMVVPADG